MLTFFCYGLLLFVVRESHLYFIVIRLLDDILCLHLFRHFES